ncbi:MAG: UDP-N-acetylmuramate--L-alanine ligase [Flavobacteriales bacterium]
MKIKEIESVYFIGIGGIGMSALARYFNAIGKRVLGYDKVKSKLCEQLEQEGMEITYVDSVNEIPEYLLDATKTLCVFTPAIPENSSIKKTFQSTGFKLYKRAEILGLISLEKPCLAVAGTHGKTSTSSILAHIMHVAETGSSAFIGGILNNYNSNLILGNGDGMVVEADEFDRSFLHLNVKHTVLTSIDADHLDIYGNHDEMKSCFKTYLSQVKGKKVIHKSIDLPKDYTYAINEQADFYAEDISMVNGDMHFTYFGLNNTSEHCVMPFPGLHNVENAVAAMALAELEGVSLDKIKSALATFKGIYRRFDVEKIGSKIQIDDYAHHPQEIKRAIDSVRAFYPNKKILTIFQPHLFSRTKDFMDEFAEILSTSDNCWIMDIYPARELPIPGITSDVLISKTKNAHKLDPILLEERLKHIDADIILTVGAGDIANYIPKIRTFMSSL